VLKFRLELETYGLATTGDLAALSSCNFFSNLPLHLNSPKLYSIKDKFNQSFGSPKVA